MGACALVAVVLAGAACGDSDGGGDSESADVETGRPEDFEATPDYLAAAIDESRGLPHRFEIALEIQVGEDSIGGDDPMVTGAFDGERTQMVLDFRELFDDLGIAGELGDDTDLSLEVISDSTTSYVRAPLVSAFADAMPPGTDPEELGPMAVMIDVFDDIGDGWARVDLTAVEDVPQKLADLGGAGQNMDPSVYLDVVRGTDSVEELGTDNIGLDAVTGLSAEVSLVEMLEAQDIDPDEAFGEMPPELADMADEFAFGVEVWIDAEARVRRVAVDMGEAMQQIADEMDEELPPGGMDFSVTMDFFDHGDESIVVEVPAEATDITDQLLVAVEGMDG